MMLTVTLGRGSLPPRVEDRRVRRGTHGRGATISLVRAGAQPDEYEKSNLSAVIVGGGIGGLAAAVALRRIGVDAHVYERASTMRVNAGTGIAIWPNGVKALRFLGDDMVHAPRQWATSPEFPGLASRLPAGAEMNDPLFPLL